jgi:hypothetical protein
VHQPPQVVFHPFAFEVFAGLHKDAEELLKRLQGLVSQIELAHDDFVWFSVCRRITYTIAPGRWGDNWLLVFRVGRPRVEGLSWL